MQNEIDPANFWHDRGSDWFASDLIWIYHPNTQTLVKQAGRRRQTHDRLSLQQQLKNIYKNRGDQK